MRFMYSRFIHSAQIFVILLEFNVYVIVVCKSTCILDFEIGSYNSNGFYVDHDKCRCALALENNVENLLSAIK